MCVRLPPFVYFLLSLSSRSAYCHSYFYVYYTNSAQNDRLRFAISPQKHFAWNQSPEGNLAYSLTATQIIAEAVYSMQRRAEGHPNWGKFMLWRDEVVIFSSDFQSLVSSVMMQTMQTLVQLGFDLSPPQMPRRWHSLHRGGLAAMEPSDSKDKYVSRVLVACYRLRVDDEYVWCDGKRRGLYKAGRVADAVADFNSFLERAKTKGILPAWLECKDLADDKSLRFAWRAAEWDLGPLLSLRLLADEIEGRWRMPKTLHD